MAAIRGRGNKSTETAFLSLLKTNKIRGWRRHYLIEGNPDFAFPKDKIAIFIDGCFWHGCKKCIVKPKSNAKFWERKIQQNKKRDRKVNKTLKERSWKVIRIWEHDMTKSNKIISALKDKIR